MSNENQRAQGRSSSNTRKYKNNPARPEPQGNCFASTSSKRKSVKSFMGRPTNAFGSFGNYKAPSGTNSDLQMLDIQPTFPTPEPN